MKVTINATDLVNYEDISFVALKKTIFDELRQIRDICFDQLQIVFDTVRIGAETCATALRYTSIDVLCRLADSFHCEGKNVSFVTPVIAEYDWPTVRRMMTGLIRNGAIDNIVANDFGIIALAHDMGIPVTMGRLFDKRLRDPRVNSQLYLSGEPEECGVFSSAYTELLLHENITSIELEMLELGLKEDVPEFIKQVGFHVPFTLITSGMICEYSGLTKSNEQKFYIGQCIGQCRNILSTTHSMPLRTSLIKRCNAVYMTCQTTPQQIARLSQNPKVHLIYTPRVW